VIRFGTKKRLYPKCTEKSRVLMTEKQVESRLPLFVNFYYA
jgi:hypothetical protein